MRYDNFMTSIGMHNRWHINRRQYNPECDYCKAIGMQPDFAFPLQNAPVRGPRRHDLPIAVISPGGPDGIFGRPTGGASTRTGSDTARPFFIYGLHAGDCAYRYIGTSRNPYMRLAVHKSNTRTGKGITGSNKRLYEWTTSIGADNLAMDILDGPIFSLPETIEREWCFFFHIQNYDMLNLHPERLTGWRNGPNRL